MRAIAASSPPFMLEKSSPCIAEGIYIYQRTEGDGTDVPSSCVDTRCRGRHHLLRLINCCCSFGLRLAITGHRLHALPLCMYDLQHFVFTPAPLKPDAPQPLCRSLRSG